MFQKYSEYKVLVSTRVLRSKWTGPGQFIYRNRLVEYIIFCSFSRHYCQKISHKFVEKEMFKCFLNKYIWIFADLSLYEALCKTKKAIYTFKHKSFCKQTCKTKEFLLASQSKLNCKTPQVKQYFSFKVVFDFQKIWGQESNKFDDSFNFCGSLFSISLIIKPFYQTSLPLSLLQFDMFNRPKFRSWLYAI